MDRGLYTATSGGLLNARRVDIVGHNIANSSTVGYKAERLVSRQQEFGDTLAKLTEDKSPRAQGDHDRTPGVVHIETVTDFTVGPISETGNPLDVALPEKNQFFAIQTPQGEAYTKAGSFTLNSESTIVTPDGLPVLGDGGPISVTGANVKISGNGGVYSDGTFVGKLKIVSIPDTKQLERTEGTRFKFRGGAGQTENVDNAQLVPGAVEMSNTGVVESMVEMISAQKSFESYAKTAQTISELNDVSLRTSRSA
jgi:flagellar basal-body rod protein FlgF